MFNGCGTQCPECTGLAEVLDVAFVRAGQHVVEWFANTRDKQRYVQAISILEACLDFDKSPEEMKEHIAQHTELKPLSDILEKFTLTKKQFFTLIAFLTAIVGTLKMMWSTTDKNDAINIQQNETTNIQQVFNFMFDEGVHQRTITSGSTDNSECQKAMTLQEEMPKQ
jgi:hypothetical protein